MRIENLIKDNIDDSECYVHENQFNVNVEKDSIEVDLHLHFDNESDLKEFIRLFQLAKKTIYIDGEY